MRLIIAEKPLMAEKIAKALGGRKEGMHYSYPNGYITSCRGHLYCLQDPEDYREEWKTWTIEHLPIMPEQMKIKQNKDKGTGPRIGAIKKLMWQATEVVNAGDPGREGQAIVDELLEEAGWIGQTKRIMLYDLNPDPIKKAYSELEDNNKYKPLYDSARARAHADWLVGMNFSRLWTKKVEAAGGYGTFHVGRVQSPTLKLVVDRDREIENFTPTTHFIPYIELTHKDGNFIAKWLPPENIPSALGPDKEGRLVDHKRAISLIMKPGTTAIVTEYNRLQKERIAPKPYSLGDLQEAASRAFNMPADRVLEIAQSLYDTHHATTYPRTDNNFIPESEWQRAPEVIRAVVRVVCAGAEMDRYEGPKLEVLKKNLTLERKPVVFNDSKVGEHFAIIPTGNISNFENMSNEERMVFSLIVERYLLQFTRPHVYHSSKVTLKTGDHLWVANGRTNIDRGWQILREGLASNLFDDNREGKHDKEHQQTIPTLRSGETLPIKHGGLTEKITRPPNAYTDALLIKQMANVHQIVEDEQLAKQLKDAKGLGESATRTGIVKMLIERQYIVVGKGGRIKSTPRGRFLIDHLPSDLTDPGLTAIWEKGLDAIAKGLYPFSKFMDHQKNWIISMVNAGRVTDVEITREVSLSMEAEKKNSSKKHKARKNGKKYIKRKNGNGNDKTKITWLSVPYEDKDEAKALGARFSGQKKQWYAPDGMPLDKFDRWREK